MTQAPQQPMPQQPQPGYGRPTPPPSNGLGVAGFITSLVGLLLTCGILCPLGLLFSLIALLKKPRGFAIAGTVIGGLGTAFLVLAGFSMFMAVMGLMGLVDQGMNETAAHGSAVAIYNYYQQNQVLPDDVEAASLLPSVEEISQQQGSDLGAEWLKRYQPKYEKIDALNFRIVLPGKDLEYETGDDFSRTFDVENMPADPSEFQNMQNVIKVK